MNDTLSDVLRTVRLTGAAFFDVTATSPWVEEAPPGPSIRPAVLPGVEHLISYHAVTEGACWVGRVNDPPVRLEAGEVVIFPHGDAHVLCSKPGMREDPKHLADVKDLRAYFAARRARLPIPISVGGGGAQRVRLVCGYLGCDLRPFNPLVAALPPMLTVSDREGGSKGWLGRLLQLALQESSARQSGGEAVLARLSELLFVEAIRRHVETLPEGRTGWLAGLRDPFVGRALAALHARPAHPWTVAALAREAGLSRSALAERFAALVGQPPMQYLAQWRLQVASGRIAAGEKVAASAREVGYESEAAFSRAFKKAVGLSPAAWRTQQHLRASNDGPAGSAPALGPEPIQQLGSSA